MSFFYSQLIFKPPYPTTSFAGQTVIVTGSNVGLGLEAAKHLARLDAAKVILAVRNLEQGEDAKRVIESSPANKSSVEVWELDLASFDSVKAFAARASKELQRLDVLLLNASIATGTFRLAEGYESSVTINLLSTILLLFLMLPLLEKTAKSSPTPAAPPRISVVVSTVHRWATLPPSKYPDGKILSTLSTEKGRNMANSYPESKLLQVLVLREIASLLTKANSGVVLNMVNPGLCHSKLSREAGWRLEVFKFFFARTTEVGSRTLVASAAAGKESHGGYMNDSTVQEEGDAAGVSQWVRSEEGKEMQNRLWEEVKGVLEGLQPGVTKM